jgi:malate dehydrogenase (oxaloacetate-decarboxylating)
MPRSQAGTTGPRCAALSVRLLLTRLAMSSSQWEEVSIKGQALLDRPLLNKGSAFTEDERRALGLLGILPPHVSTLEEQLARAYENYKRKDTELERYIFLGALQDRNETLFYRLVQQHITEMMPVIYTPGVGAGCQQYSHIYRRPRGLYISYPHITDLDAMLDNAPTRSPEIIVITDGERILGLGDLGVGGMGIPIGKLALYTVCAGINPAATFPIMLDVGTNNEALLADPLYLGWRHRRVDTTKYDEFIDAFVAAVIRRFPDALLQWEDFSKNNAARLLARYRDRLCTFNDDIQGTGAVTLAGLVAATQLKGECLGEQRIAILGAGSSAIGISEQLVAAMTAEGMSAAGAREVIWLVDSHGLVHTDRAHLEPAKKPYAQAVERTGGWRLGASDRITLDDVVRNIHPTVLIGSSAQSGAFTESLIREMAGHVQRPIVFPLSNPTSKSEATPSDLVVWTAGRALIATGSPFDDVPYNGRAVRIGQCNNAFIFPGVGLGVTASGARRVTDEMFVAAARTLSRWSPAFRHPDDALYPRLEAVREISCEVAIAVAREAQRAGLCAPAVRELSPDLLASLVRDKMWEPRYRTYVPRPTRAAVRPS